MKNICAAAAVVISFSAVQFSSVAATTAPDSLYVQDAHAQQVEETVNPRGCVYLPNLGWVCG